MLSIPHMIVVFLVVLIVFGPHKLPELARGLGKLMAEFRKASTDFRTAFDEEMRDLERQARVAELKKQAATEVAAVSATTGENPTATLASTVDTAVHPVEPPASTWIAEAPVITPVAEAVARSSGDATKVQTTDAPLEDSTSSRSENSLHDKQHPA